MNDDTNVVTMKDDVNTDGVITDGDIVDTDDANVNTDGVITDNDDDATVTNDDQTKDKGKNNKPNIGGFFKSMARFIVYICIVVFLGTGFKIILTHYDPTAENPNIFPGMDINDVPYSNSGKSTVGKKTDLKNSHGLARFFERLFPMNEWSFPYKNMYSKTGSPGILGNIILWITETIAYSNQLIRKMIGIIIASLSDYKNSTYAFWVFGLLILFSLPLIPLVGLVTGFAGPFMAIERIWVGWKVFLLLCLPFLIPAIMYVFSIFVTSSVFAYTQLIYTVIMATVFLLIFPYSRHNASTMVKETLSQHRYGILRAVLLGVVINSFRYLNTGFGIGALSLFILTLFGLV